MSLSDALNNSSYFECTKCCFHVITPLYDCTVLGYSCGFTGLLLSCKYLWVCEMWGRPNMLLDFYAFKWFTWRSPHGRSKKIHKVSFLIHLNLKYPINSPTKAIVCPKEKKIIFLLHLWALAWIPDTKNYF